MSTNILPYDWQDLTKCRTCEFCKQYAKTYLILRITHGLETARIIGKFMIDLEHDQVTEILQEFGHVIDVERNIADNFARVLTARFNVYSKLDILELP